MLQADGVRRTARSILVEWANDQDAWVRAIVGEILVTRRELAPSVLDQVKRIYFAEKQLTNDTLVDIPPRGHHG